MSSFPAPLAAAFAALALFALPALASPITIGPGPVIGVDRAGVTWRQEFQDWTAADVKALDPAGLADATYAYHDGLDDSRDLIAFYEREENNKVFFRADFYDLALGAETSGVNLYVAIDCAPGGQAWLPDFVNVQTDHAWELCLCLYQPGTGYGTDYRLYDAAFGNITTGYLGSYWNSQLDAVEFGLDRQVLVNAGWNGSSPIHFQPFTTKDGAATSCASSSKLTDAFTDSDRGCSDGVLNGSFTSTSTAGVVWYASIAHGNQSVNPAGEIGVHIYDSQAATGIAGGTGFQRTLDTHEMFGVPLNIHPSGTLTTACLWASRSGGASDPQDGPAFVARIRQFVDADQGQQPGSLIGGVFAEHILPYFEGEVNAASIALTDSLNQVAYGVSAAEARVMHSPERVLRSVNTGLSPLDGHTFEDIAASPYTATVIDEVTHLHRWFYPGENCTTDEGYRHKLHKVNGVYCFVINDREDQGKFGNWDGGMVMDSRFSLLQKAIGGSSSEIVVVFDDWEALAGKSFDPVGGNVTPNNNPNQYHNTIRWAANHPWIRISNLRDLLTTALASPTAFVIDHGYRFDLPIETYEYLMHSSEDSYDGWYYANNGGTPVAEQDFYHLVPVLTGAQGDYHSRGVGVGGDGPGLPSGRMNGDLNTPNTLIHDAWAALQAAPAGRLRTLGIASFLTMIYETAWHEEDAQDYSNSCYGPWQYPDASWDGVNTWALRLSNHVRWSGLYAAAAQWAATVRTGGMSANTALQSVDLDQDGEAEYVLENDRSFAVLERWGGRVVLACAYDPTRQDADVIVGAPVTNPSTPGEEELAGALANRCSAFKDMNGGTYADAPYTITALPPVADSPAAGYACVSPDGKISKTIVLDGRELSAYYAQTVGSTLYVRIGLSPNPLDLLRHGQAHLAGALVNATTYRLSNSAGAAAQLSWPAGVTFGTSLAHETSDRRNLALIEEEELYGPATFHIALRLLPDTSWATAGVGAGAAHAAFALLGPWPSPGTGAARFAVQLTSAARVRWQLLDVSGREAAAGDLGTREPGRHEIAFGSHARALQPGLYFVRVRVGERTATAKWAVVR